jgi:hypothetical protein
MPLLALRRRDPPAPCATRPNIDCRIVPCSGGWNPSLEGGFLMIKQDKLDPVVVLENRRSGLFLHEYGEVTAYQQAVDQITEIALTAKRSKAVLREAIRRVEARSV